MPDFLFRTHYTPKAWRTLLDNPADRTDAVRSMFEQSGCTMRDMWYAVGGHAGYVLFSAPDNTAATAATLVATASGMARECYTIPLLTPQELLTTLEHAGRVSLATPSGITALEQ